MGIARNIDTVKLAAAEALWPTRCAICDTPGYLLCPKCARDLTFIDHLKSCPKCGEPFGRVQCATCQNEAPFDGCVSATMLDKNSGGIVTLFKDSGEIRLSKVMAYYISKALPPDWYSPSCFVTFIPASKQAFNRRGFDHCEILAKELSARINGRFISVFMRPNAQDQRNLGRRGRMANLNNIYKIQRSKKDILTRLNIPIIIVDDVFTTGSTLYSASKVLRTLGISTIYCGIFSRTF